MLDILNPFYTTLNEVDVRAPCERWKTGRDYSQHLQLRFHQLRDRAGPASGISFLQLHPGRTPAETLGFQLQSIWLPLVLPVFMAGEVGWDKVWLVEPAGGDGPCSSPRVQPKKLITSVAVSPDLTHGPSLYSGTLELARKYQAVPGAQLGNKMCGSIRATCSLLLIAWSGMSCDCQPWLLPWRKSTFLLHNPVQATALPSVRTALSMQCVSSSAASGI